MLIRKIIGLHMLLTHKLQIWNASLFVESNFVKNLKIIVWIQLTRATLPLDLFAVFLYNFEACWTVFYLSPSIRMFVSVPFISQYKCPLNLYTVCGNLFKFAGTLLKRILNHIKTVTVDWLNKHLKCQRISWNEDLKIHNFMML